MTSKEDRWRPITVEELAKHNDLDNGDAWIAIKGVVYDVTTYAAKHPGGAEKIRKYAGKDATETFNMVHSYVNPVSILGGLQVGILKGARDAPKRTICSRLSEKSWCFGSKYNKMPTSYFKQDSIVATYGVEFYHNSHEWDWSVGVTEKRFLHVYKCLGTKKAWLSVIELPDHLESDQLSVNFRSNYKLIQISLRKPLPTSIWAQQTHGLKNNGQFVSVTEGHSKFDAYITYKKCLTPNVLLFGVQVVSSARFGIPLGFHVDLHHGDISRPYTPICFVLMDKNSVPHTAHAREKKQMEDVPITILYFMIKIYPNGAFTRALDEIELDDGREIPTLQVSTPHGYFDAGFLQDFTVLFLIAAGSGLTPMTRILQSFWYLNDKLRGKRIAFWHFCQKEYDLIWKKQFTELEDATSWCHYFPVLTRPGSESWQGLKGRICPHIINTCISDMNLDKRGKIKACICGPPGFNSSAINSLSGIVLSENIFVFSN